MQQPPLPETDADITAERIGARARAIREELGRSRTETAFRIGVSAEGLDALEAGTRLPTLGQLYRLAGAQSVPTGDLLPGL